MTLERVPVALPNGKPHLVYLKGPSYPTAIHHGFPLFLYILLRTFTSYMMSSDSAFPPVRRDRVRVTSLLAKKPDMTDEEFYKYWQEVHGPLFANLDVVKKNILKYEQHHYNSAAEKGAIAMGFDGVPYRGVAVFEAESFEKIFEVFQSEEYARVVLPDEANFIIRSKTGFIAGPLITYIDRN